MTLKSLIWNSNVIHMLSLFNLELDNSSDEICFVKRSGSRSYLNTVLLYG